MVMGMERFSDEFPNMGGEKFENRSKTQNKKRDEHSKSQ